MNIGIFTLAGTTNYGGALQTFALSEYLKFKGHNVEIVIIRSEERTSPLRRFVGILTTYTLKEMFALFFSDRIWKKRKKHLMDTNEITAVFNQFYKQNLHFTQPVPLKELPKFVNRYDVLITGSDQVWTDVYSKTLYYFFDSLQDFSGKRISYAACSAHSKAAIYNRAKLKKLFLRFDAISVRDEVTAKLVQHYCTRPVPIVADPTLLYDFEHTQESFMQQQKYIFCYILGEEPKGGGHIEAIKKIKNHVGNIKVIAINRTNIDYSSYFDEERNEASPMEWVSLIRNASFIYTNSFHALLFALRFHKPFLTYYTEVIRASRLLALRDYYGLGDNIAQSLTTWKYQPVDWNSFDKKKEALQAKSMDFLEQNL